MTNKEIEQEIEELLKLQNIFELKSVQDVNHKPHRFMIGTEHIVDASNNHGGMLGEATLEKISCAHPGCQLMYKDHKSDKVVFLSLLRDAQQEEVRDILVQLVTVGKEIIAGISFVETEQKFRIREQEEEY